MKQDMFEKMAALSRECVLEADQQSVTTWHSYSPQLFAQRNPTGLKVTYFSTENIQSDGELVAVYNAEDEQPYGKEKLINYDQHALGAVFSEPHEGLRLRFELSRK